MRKINLIYPSLATKQVGQRLAIRDPQQISHLRVLRVDRIPYQFTVSDGIRYRGELELIKYTKDEGILFELISKTESQAALGPSNFLLLPVLRWPKLEAAISLATQFNFYHKIFVYFGNYSRYQAGDLSENKKARLEHIAQSAFSQSRAEVLPEISAYENLESALRELPTTLSNDSIPLFCIPDLASPRLDLQMKSELSASQSADGEAYAKILVLGPEGGFSELERKALDTLNTKQDWQTKNFVNFSFGSSVLTTEAAVAAFTTLLIPVS